MIGLETYSFSFTFPRTETPEWAAKVERWYQLDAAAFALPETFWQHRQCLQTRPEVIFLASPLASNTTDAQFVRTAAPSPAKFVHTLPNIRGASLLAVMEWSGEVYCIQKDPETALTAISEGMHTVKASGKEAWVATVTEEIRSQADISGNFTGHILRLLPDPSGCRLKIGQNHSLTMANATGHDKDLFLWIKKGSGHFSALDFTVADS